MPKIAIIQFPGTNCEYETARAVRAAGMEADLVRWNEDYNRLRKYDGYIIPGGFSYEDRVRAGAIAARDPVMEIIKKEAVLGKPVLGICNGAQILVESGLVPGVKFYNEITPSFEQLTPVIQPPLYKGENKSSASFRDTGQWGVSRRSVLRAALAANSKGWLNIWVEITNTAEPGRCAFNNFSPGYQIQLPIAHGEGRFVIPEDLLKHLIENQQTVFRYCDKKGRIKEEYPINPNGSVYNLAGVCNEQGNVLALMPHPERVAAGAVIFESMRKYLEKEKNWPVKFTPAWQDLNKPRQSSLSKDLPSPFPSKLIKIEKYQSPKNSLEFFVDLIITDNEAETLANTLRQMGFAGVQVAKKVHWEVTLKTNQESVNKTEKLAIDLIQSGELLNTNKELAYVRQRENLWQYSDNKFKEIDALPGSENTQLLVRYKDDFIGQAKREVLVNRLGIKETATIKRGVVWQIKAADKWQKILETNLLFNPYSMIAFYI